jgi:hypothetical protein
MKAHKIVWLLVWLLPSLWLRAAAGPAAGMFSGRVTDAATAGSSLKERAAAICRQWASEKNGTWFFTAWAFPAAEQLNCRGRRRDGGHDNGPLALKNRDGRITVDGDREMNIGSQDREGAEKNVPAWGVVLFLNRVEGNGCRISDVQLLAADRRYDLGNERLAWLGTADESQGLEFLRGLLGKETDRELRHDLVFVLYLFDGQAAVSELIDLARRDPDQDVRKEAIFWLGQKASAAAVKALGDVVASPEAMEIKKQAVFAISQLPENIGTPLLLDIARRNPYPRLRKEAIFWLGQSDDPRALDLFTEILTK